MRCLILVAFCVSSAFAFDLNTYQVARVKAPNVQLNLGPSNVLRAKRDVRVHSLNDTNDCIQNCTQKMSEGMITIKDEDSETVKMTKMCKAMEPVEACYQTCPDSQMRKLMLDFLPLMKQPCILGTDRVEDLKKALDCLNSTSDAISAKCDPVCNGSFAGDVRLESHILLNVDPAFVMYDEDKIQNREMLKSTCMFLSCEHQCGDPITKTQCGQAALDVDRKITASIFGSVSKLYMDLDALDGTVKECQNILA